jgi:GT2 family glycosyltransferase
MAQPDSTFSVVIPARNAEAFVATAVTSALLQTTPALEVIVADDGSTDETTNVVRGLTSERVRILEGGPSSAAAARNRAIRASSGSFIAFLDADDVWYPNKLECQARAFASPDVVAVGALFRFRIGDRVRGVRGEMMTAEKHDRVRQARLMPLTFSSLVVRCDVLDRVGLLDEELQYGEDLEFLARLAQVGDIVVLDAVLGEYRVHAGGLSRTNQIHNEEWVRFVEARTAARANGSDLSWAEFELVDSTGDLRARRRLAAARDYQNAGSLFASSAFFEAAVTLLRAFVRDPRYTALKLTQQRLWRR